MRELTLLSRRMYVYASNKDCAMRIKENTMDILGDVYVISHAKIRKLEENTLGKQTYKQCYWVELFYIDT